MSCKHRNTESRWHMDTIRNVLVRRRRCVDCEELVGMGPASEPWIEVKAAEIVAEILDRIHPDRLTSSYRHGWDGVRYAATDMAMWHAGHLARCIADHDELQRIGEGYDTRLTRQIDEEHAAHDAASERYREFREECAAIILSELSDPEPT